MIYVLVLNGKIVSIKWPTLLHDNDVSQHETLGLEPVEIGGRLEKIYNIRN
jgi:hypothetical protein